MPSKLGIEVFKTTGIDVRLRQQLVGLLASSWENAAELLTESLTRVDTILVGRDEAGRVLGFQTWKIQEFALADGRSFGAAYIGIGAIDFQHQGVGLGKDVVYGGINVAKAELARAFPIGHIYSTTISPIAYLGLSKGYPEKFNPRADGTYDREILPVLSTLKLALGATPKHEDPHPFILRGFSKKRYTERIQDKLSEVKDIERIPLFDQNGLDEGRGDRLIVIF